jgi:hypothetical protein
MKKYLVILFILCLATPVFAVQFIRDGVNYTTDKKSKIKNKVRTKYYQEGVAKKIKLSGDKKSWEKVDA